MNFANFANFNENLNIECKVHAQITHGNATSEMYNNIIYIKQQFS